MTEDIIFNKLTTDNNFFSNVFGNLKKEDFTSQESKFIYSSISELYSKYKKAPNLNELALYIDNKDVNIKSKTLYRNKLEELEKVNTSIDQNILVDSVEKYIKKVRTEQVLIQGAEILDGTDKKNTLESIQKKFEEINKLSFKKTGGHDYKEDSTKRFEEYSKKQTSGIKSNIELIDIATGGGFQKRKLTIFLAIINSGKSLAGAHCAVEAIKQGEDVAIFSFEDGEMAYASRVDCNLLNKTQDEMKKLGTSLKTSFDFIMEKGLGRLKIKEYPPRGASSLNIRSQLDDWKLKENFIPSLIIIDAINIASPSTKTDGLFMTGKIVAEDFRAIAVDYDCHVISMAQLDRSAFGSTTVGMENSGESIGIPATADTLISLVNDPHRDNIRIISILKSREVNKQKYKPTVINCITEYQRFSDLEDGEVKYIKQESKDSIRMLEQVVDDKIPVGEDVLKALFN